MGKDRKAADGIDELIALFPASSHRTVERLLRRAREMEARAAGLSAQAAMRKLGQSLPGGRNQGFRFEAELAKALHFRDDARGKASIRHKAPDTGGRPFHFAHSVVKADTSASGSRSAGSRAKGGPADGSAKSGDGDRAGRAAAHMRYIEREIAVERVPDREMDGAEIGGRATREREPDQEHGAEVVDIAHATAASAGQTYVENPAKLATGEMIASSFGTIGDRFEDRIAFWDALERAERHPDARVQHRLIVELPHEASPQARLEMMQRFCSRFEDDGVPYWAALHAPGAKNDDRNFHAHVVYSERPARRMVDPRDPEGALKWDFEITIRHKTKSRNTVIKRPFMQNKLEAYRKLDSIKSLRAEFSGVVNAVLERDDVRDAKGGKVRYDARSYRDMGLDVVPMRSINRIVTDKTRKGKSSVFDGEYTKRVVADALREAAARREKDVLEVVALDEAVGAAIAPGRRRRPAPPLPKELRSSSLPSLPTAALKPAGERLVQARREALQVDVMERAAVVSLERAIAATSPKAAEAAAKTKNDKVRAEVPDPEALRVLHAAALEELEETRLVAAERKRSLRYRVAAATDAWRQIVNAPSSTMLATTKRILAEVDAYARSDGDMGERGASDGIAKRPAIVSEMPAREPAPATSSLEATRATAPAPRSAAPPIRVPTRPLGAAAPTGIHRPLPGLQEIPTLADLAAASAGISRALKAIAHNVEDPDTRMAAVKQLRIDMAAGLRQKKAEYAAVLERQRHRAAPREDIGLAGQAEKAGEPGTRGSVAGLAAPEPGSEPSAVTVTIALEPGHERQVVEPAADVVSPAADMIDAPEATDPDAADDERRRKAREKELAKRAKKRKAVLGRRNREKDIGR